MRISLRTKFVGLYVIIVAFLFIFANTYGSHFLFEQITKEKKSQLYEYSHYIQEQYADTALDNPSLYITESLYEQVKNSDTILNTRTWFCDANGTLLLDSADFSYSDQNINLLYYDENFFYSSSYTNKTLEPFISQPVLSVLLPVVKNFSTKGYIVVHYPMENLKNQLYSNLNTINLVLGIFSVCLAGAFFYLGYITVRPTKKLLAFVKNNNSGNYQDVSPVHSGDEYNDMSLELSYMAEQLKNLDDYHKNFIANVSHDFRSPLTSIKGYGEAMLDGTIPPELYNKYLDIIVFEAERLTKLTTNLLSLNQFERGKSSLDIISFDINQTIKRTAASFEGTCTQKHIKLKLTFSEKETFVQADKEKIQQVLYNLLDNAIKFSNNQSEIHISTIEKREKVLISVKDFGIGIPKENLKKIWERFYKTDLSRGKDKKGTGLGLSITKEIITAHNENINVISTVGAGTEFTFSLPLTTPNEIAL